MESSVVVEKLRALQLLVSRPEFSEEAFDLWHEVKDHLPAEHRFRLIVAWSKTIGPENRDEFARACGRVIEDLEGGGESS